MAKEITRRNNTGYNTLKSHVEITLEITRETTCRNNTGIETSIKHGKNSGNKPKK